MEFDLPISPYIRTTYNKDYVYTDIATAKAVNDPKCLKLNSVYNTFYMMYLPEMNFDADTYFDGITSMMNKTSILANSKFVSNLL